MKPQVIKRKSFMDTPSPKRRKLMDGKTKAFACGVFVGCTACLIGLALAVAVIR